MRQSKFSQEQIVQILREAEKPGADVKSICRTHGVSGPTFYRWKKAYGGLSVDQGKRLKQLEQENARMRKLIVDRDLELEVAREIIKKNW
jgi:putative transposase